MCVVEREGAWSLGYQVSDLLLPSTSLNGFSVSHSSATWCPGPHSISPSCPVTTATLCSSWGWRVWVYGSRIYGSRVSQWGSIVAVSTLGWHMTVHSESDLPIPGPEIKQCLNRLQAPECRLSIGG